MPLTYCYEPELGETIVEAAEAAIYHAAAEDTNIALIFNGIVLRVDPYTSEIDDIVEAYHKRITIGSNQP